MDHGGVFDAAVFDADAEAAGYFEREDRRAVAGDSTADWTRDAQRGGFGKDWATHDLGGLRCVAGGWGNTHRGNHRRDGGTGPCGEEVAGERETGSGCESNRECGRGGECGNYWWDAAAGSLLHRRRGGDRGHEYRYDRERRVHRTARYR